MAGTINKVILIGHLGDEVKMHYFEGGNAIGRFPIATNETYTNKQTGEKVTTTEWHNIVVRNKLVKQGNGKVKTELKDTPQKFTWWI